MTTTEQLSCSVKYFFHFYGNLRGWFTWAGLAGFAEVTFISILHKASRNGGVHRFQWYEQYVNYFPVASLVRQAGPARVIT